MIDLQPFDEALAEFVRLAEAHCFVPLVTYIPSAYIAYGAFVTFADAEAGPVLRRYSDRQRAYLAAAAARFSYRFLDLTPVLMEGATVDRLLYYPSTVHLSLEGNKAVAAALAAGTFN